MCSDAFRRGGSGADKEEKSLTRAVHHIRQERGARDRAGGRLRSVERSRHRHRASRSYAGSRMAKKYAEISQRGTLFPVFRQKSEFT